MSRNRTHAPSHAWGRGAKRGQKNKMLAASRGHHGKLVTSSSWKKWGEAYGGVPGGVERTGLFLHQPAQTHHPSSEELGKGGGVSDVLQACLNERRKYTLETADSHAESPAIQVQACQAPDCILPL